MAKTNARKFHYIYKITRIDDSGKFYIGMHSTDNLDDGYFGSGQLLKKSIKKYGAEMHIKEILEFLPSRKELKDRERQLITEELLADKRCMNLMLGGEGGWSHIELRGDKNPMRRPEIAKKVSDSLKASITPEDRLARSKRMSTIRAAMTVQPRQGKFHSAESKALMSLNRCGKGGWSKGLKLGPDSQETKDKKRQAALTRVAAGYDMGALSRGIIKILKEVQCPHCGLKGKGPNMTRYHFDKCKRNPSKT